MIIAQIDVKMLLIQTSLEYWAKKRRKMDLKIYLDVQSTEYNQEIRIFHFLTLIEQRRKLTEEDVSQLLGELEDKF